MVNQNSTPTPSSPDIPTPTRKGPEDAFLLLAVGAASTLTGIAVDYVVTRDDAGAARQLSYYESELYDEVESNDLHFGKTAREKINNPSFSINPNSANELDLDMLSKYRHENELKDNIKYLEPLAKPKNPIPKILSIWLEGGGLMAAGRGLLVQKRNLSANDSRKSRRVQK
jgi:hypothetical protein